MTTPRREGPKGGDPGLSQSASSLVVCVFIYTHMCMHVPMYKRIYSEYAYTAKRVPQHNLLNGFLKER